MEIVLASNNAKKLSELKVALPANFLLRQASEFSIPSPEETGTTFVENAIIKARHAAKISGLAAIADDSGLEVDFLRGAPGIRSSRFAGTDATDTENNIKLLESLADLPISQRQARFRCVIVLMRHHLDPMPIIASGTWNGSILTSPKGDNGFGYDPIFYVPEHGMSSAQLAPSEKNKISHRGQAIKQLEQLLQDTK